jgi:hypothetical protein
VSLLPLATAWMAVSELAPQPVAFYAAVFYLVNATHVFLIWELIGSHSLDVRSRMVRRIMRVRSIATLCLFGLAAVVALKYPRLGLGICCCCLIGYVRPDAPGAGKGRAALGGRTPIAPGCPPQPGAGRSTGAPANGDTPRAPSNRRNEPGGSS